MTCIINLLLFIFKTLAHCVGKCLRLLDFMK